MSSPFDLNLSASRREAPRECSPFIAVQPSELTRHTHQNLDALDILFNCLKRLGSRMAATRPPSRFGNGLFDRPTSIGTHAI